MADRRSSYVTFEEPDIVFWHLIGNVEESDIIKIYEEMLAFTEGKSEIFMLTDVAKMKSMTAAARRAAATGPAPGKKIMRVRSSAIIGASFQIRVLGLLITKAAKLFNPSNDVEINYCDTEAEGRAWINQRRRAINSGTK